MKTKTQKIIQSRRITEKLSDRQIRIALQFNLSGLSPSRSILRAKTYK